jgi:hypothetical protein
MTVDELIVELCKLPGHLPVVTMNMKQGQPVDIAEHFKPFDRLDERFNYEQAWLHDNRVPTFLPLPGDEAPI